MDLAKRFKQNPLLSPKDIKPSRPGMKVECLLNPGVFQLNDQTGLVVRVAERPKQTKGKISFPIYNKEGGIEILSFDETTPDLDASDPRIVKYQGEDYLTTLSHLRVMYSEDNIHFKEQDETPPLFGEGPQETFGIEDCRVTTMDDGYHLTYTKVSAYGVAVGYIYTRDWQSFERRGMIFPPHNKDCAFFDEPINGKYYALHRPSSPELGGNYIWLAESPDKIHWGHHRLLATTRKGKWDSARIGAGAAPIKTKKGWLEIYHGATKEHRYCLGALLMDLKNPSRVIARSQEPIMEPLMDYELNGFFGSVVFTNGHLVNGDTITMYYGAADRVICGAQFSINEILRSLNLPNS